MTIAFKDKGAEKGGSSKSSTLAKGQVQLTSFFGKGATLKQASTCEPSNSRGIPDFSSPPPQDQSSGGMSPDDSFKLSTNTDADEKKTPQSQLIKGSSAKKKQESKRSASASRGKPVAKKRNRSKATDNENKAEEEEEEGKVSKCPKLDDEEHVKSSNVATGSNALESIISEKDNIKDNTIIPADVMMETSAEEIRAQTVVVDVNEDEDGDSTETDVKKVAQEANETVILTNEAPTSTTAIDPPSTKAKRPTATKSRRQSVPKKVEEAAPPSALEIKYQTSFQTLLSSAAEHKGEAEPDYRLELSQALEIAKTGTSQPPARPASNSEGEDQEEKKEEEEIAKESTTSVDAAVTAEPNTTGSVPENVLPLIARLVQGSALPLSQLTAQVMEFLMENLGFCIETLSEEAVKEKIRRLAERKCYGTRPRDAVVIEDTSLDAVWRWDVTHPDWQPLTSAAKNVVKEARAERNNLGKHIRALAALIKVIQKNPEDSNSIAQAEEKVVALERQAEAALARKAQAARREEEQARLAAEKQERALQKEQEKLRRQQEKEEREREKQELKRKREEASEENSVRSGNSGEGGAKASSHKKKTPTVPADQPALFRFFKTIDPAKFTPCKSGGEVSVIDLSSPDKEKEKERKAALEAEKNERIEIALKSGLDHEYLLKDLKNRGLALQGHPRNPKHKPHHYVLLDVTVTKVDDGMWGATDFAELEQRRFWNAMKFLKFHEDVRPPYYGTWSHRSRDVNGRRFLGKAKTVNYEYDSEEDWEEGDGEEGDGESLADTDNDDDKEPEDGLDYNDGWLARDDEVDREDGEEGDMETSVNRGGAGANDDRSHIRVGVHFFDANFETDKPVVDERLRPAIGPLRIISVDPGYSPLALPYEEAEEKENEPDEGSSGASAGGQSGGGLPDDAKQGSTEQAGGDGNNNNNKSKNRGPRTVEAEHIPSLLRLIEGSRLGKDKLVDTFLQSHPDVASKVQIRNFIDSNAKKEKDPQGKPLWLVNRLLLQEHNVEAFVFPETSPQPSSDPQATGQDPGIQTDTGKKKQQRNKKSNKTKDSTVAEIPALLEAKPAAKTLEVFFGKASPAPTTNSDQMSVEEVEVVSSTKAVQEGEKENENGNNDAIDVED